MNSRNLQLYFQLSVHYSDSILLATLGKSQAKTSRESQEKYYIKTFLKIQQLWFIQPNFKLVKLSDPSKVRRSRPEFFCRKDVVKNFAKIHWKTPVLEHLFLNKVEGLRLWQRCFRVKFYEISQNTCFCRTPPVAVSEKLAFLWSNRLGWGEPLKHPF